MSWGPCGRSSGSGRVSGATIRRIDPSDETGLAGYVRIRNAVTPDNTDSLDQIRWEARHLSRARSPGSSR